MLEWLTDLKPLDHASKFLGPVSVFIVFIEATGADVEILVCCGEGSEHRFVGVGTGPS